MVLRDPASFLQQMGTTVTHLELVHGTSYQRKALNYKQRALRLVNERLSDPVLGISDGVVGTVVSFLTHDVCKTPSISERLANIQLSAYIQGYREI